MSLSDDIAALTGFDRPRWNSEAPLGTPIFVTYAFPTVAAPYDPFKNFSAATELHKTIIRMALQSWDAASGVHFIEVPESAGGQIRFSFVDMKGYVNATGDILKGQAYFPIVTSVSVNGATRNETGSMDLGGDTYLNADLYVADPVAMTPGMRGYSIVLHEIGHALGLKHPFEGSPVIETAHDSGAYTIMSYNRPHSTTALGSVDIAATQLLYGATDAKFSWDPSALTLTIYGDVGSDARVGTELNDILVGLGGSDLLDGKGGVDTAVFSGSLGDYKFATANGATVVADLRPGSPDGEDTLINIELLRFADATVPVSALAQAPAVAAAAAAVLGGAMTAGRSALQAKELAGELSFAQYVDGLIQEAQNTSVPALIVANALGGGAPTKEHLAELMTFANEQLQSYRAMGVAAPEMGPYEALGRGFGATGAFSAQYGALTQSDFVKTAYKTALGRDANATQQQHFDQQISYFKGLYQSAGVAEAQSALLARGAVFGQMYSHAVRDEPDLHNYDEAANAFLRLAAAGQAVYGQPLSLI